VIPGLPAGVTKVLNVTKKGARPPNLSPPGAGRNGAFREAKRQAGIPVSKHPTSVRPNIDKQGKVQPGRSYQFDTRLSSGKTQTVRIRDDAGGHDFGLGNPQNRGPHFNQGKNNHYDY
ncbi:HNH/endonuclease VII fold putative polymorphic toxin, partial [Bathymodiolus platifrons methanotrophic gill symbiont]|uniref:HNH/endonuclease VII fold putative polymorphic toxin n=1 Tax=Bathymodiolus platifrons methanotrophic gill symbiont TaxID=113268 RepID=UPI001FCDCA2C